MIEMLLKETLDERVVEEILKMEDKDKDGYLKV